MVLRPSLKKCGCSGWSICIRRLYGDHKTSALIRSLKGIDNREVTRRCMYYLVLCKHAYFLRAINCQSGFGTALRTYVHDWFTKGRGTRTTPEGVLLIFLPRVVGVPRYQCAVCILCSAGPSEHVLESIYAKVSKDQLNSHTVETAPLLPLHCKRECGSERCRWLRLAAHLTHQPEARQAYSETL